MHAPNWVGDHSMAFPFYHTLSVLFQRKELHLLGSSWISSLVPDKIFSKVITLKSKYPSATIIDSLKKEEYALGFTLSPSFRSALLLWRSRVTFRFGHKTDGRFFLLKHPNQKEMPKYSPMEHRSLSYIRLLTHFFSKNKIAEDYWSESVKKKWSFKLYKKEESKLQKIFHQNKITKKRYWLICPGSTASSKRYPTEYIINLINMIYSKRPDLKIILAGSDIEREISIKITSGIFNDARSILINLTGNTNLNELMYLIQNSSGVVANDSGIAHLTSLVHIPLVTFIGMARKEETLTLNPNKVVLNKNLSCSPCMKPECPKGYSPPKCLAEIQPYEVFEAMLSMDKKYSYL